MFKAKFDKVATFCHESDMVGKMVTRKIGVSKFFEECKNCEKITVNFSQKDKYFFKSSNFPNLKKLKIRIDSPNISILFDSVIDYVIVIGKNEKSKMDKIDFIGCNIRWIDIKGVYPKLISCSNSTFQMFSLMDVVFEKLSLIDSTFSVINIDNNTHPDFSISKKIIINGCKFLEFFKICSIICKKVLFENVVVTRSENLFEIYGCQFKEFLINKSKIEQDFLFICKNIYNEDERHGFQKYYNQEFVINDSEFSKLGFSFFDEHDKILIKKCKIGGTAFISNCFEEFEIRETETKTIHFIKCHIKECFLNKISSEGILFSEKLEGGMNIDSCNIQTLKVSNCTMDKMSFRGDTTILENILSFSEIKEHSSEKIVCEKYVLDNVFWQINAFYTLKTSFFVGLKKLEIITDPSNLFDLKIDSDIESINIHGKEDEENSLCLLKIKEQCKKIGSLYLQDIRYRMIQKFPIEFGKVEISMCSSDTIILNKIKADYVSITSVEVMALIIENSSIRELDIYQNVMLIGEDFFHGYLYITRCEIETLHFSGNDVKKIDFCFESKKVKNLHLKDNLAKRYLEKEPIFLKFLTSHFSSGINLFITTEGESSSSQTEFIPYEEDEFDENFSYHTYCLENRKKYVDNYKFDKFS